MERNEIKKEIKKRYGQFAEQGSSCCPDYSCLDAFLASKKVGPKGKVIGLDMTEQMIKRAKQNAKKGNYNNVEFKLADVEDIPVKDNSIDLVMSNCVINLTPNLVLKR